MQKVLVIKLFFPFELNWGSCSSVGTVLAHKLKGCEVDSLVHQYCFCVLGQHTSFLNAARECYCEKLHHFKLSIITLTSFLTQIMN